MPQPPHELVQRALATAIAGEPDAPQDFGAWKVLILAQPLRDLRRVRLHGRRAPGAARSRSRRHRTRAGAVHGRTPPQIRYPNRIPERSVTSAELARSWPGESLTEPIILEPVPLLSGFRKKSVVPWQRLPQRPASRATGSAPTQWQSRSWASAPSPSCRSWLAGPGHRTESVAVVTLAMHAHRDVPDPGPRIEPRAECPESAIVRGHGAPRKSDCLHAGAGRVGRARATR